MKGGIIAFLNMVLYSYGASKKGPSGSMQEGRYAITLGASGKYEHSAHLRAF